MYTCGEASFGVSPAPHGLICAVAPDDYSFVGTGGKRSYETCATFINRPKQPIIIYEFQVRRGLHSIFAWPLLARVTRLCVCPP